MSLKYETFVPTETVLAPFQALLETPKALRPLLAERGLKIGRFSTKKTISTLACLPTFG